MPRVFTPPGPPDRAGPKEFSIAVAHDKKKKHRDDELFPDAPAAKKAKTTKHERADKPSKVEKALEKAPEPPPKTKTAKVEKKPADEPPPKAKTGKHERPAPAAAAATGGPSKALIAGIGVCAALLGGAIIVGPTLLQSEETHRPPTKLAVTGQQPPSPKPTVQLDARPQPTPAVTKPSTPPPAAVTLQPVKPATPDPAPAAAKAQPKQKSKEELSKRSANHAALAQFLDQFDAIRKVDLTSDDRLFENFQQKQRREQELIDQIRALGIAGLGALKDMILELDDGGYRLLLAKAIAGMTSPDALKASAEILGSVQDIAIQTTLVRFLPETQDAAAVVAGAFGNEQNPNVRSMLLREYARRVGEPDMGEPDFGHPRAAAVDRDSGREVFRKAALEDPDPNVRAEAVAIIGRRGDQRDMELMAQIMKTETNLQIRQAAIVSYATTGNEGALTNLEDLARRDDSLEIRASAVLGIARVGTERAIQILDQIAQSDPREEIRMRASGFAQGLRAKAEADRQERNHPKVDQTPVPLDPGPGQPRPGE